MPMLTLIAKTHSGAASDWLYPILFVALQCFLLLQVLAVGAIVFIWLERKVSGRIQDRLGPTRVGGKFGWLQGLADGIKLISKEDLIPTAADRLLFKAAPYICVATSMAAFSILPFANGWVVQYVNIGLFLLLAVLGLNLFGIILAGYASGSKWSLFGAIREAAQAISYEIPLAVCVVVPVMLCGTMNLVTIGNMQAGWFTNWLIFHDPFSFCTFWVFFTCALASVNRAPFDLVEAESELVAGFHTEYSGMRWSLFFLAEYSNMFIVGGLGVILFLGAWHGPIPLTTLTGLANETANVELTESHRFADTSFSSLPSTAKIPAVKNSPEPEWYWVQLANLLGCVNFMIKSVLLVVFMIWIRWTLPRLRIDQVMSMCLKYCIPLAIIFFMGTLTWQLCRLPSANDLFPLTPRYGIYERGTREYGAADRLMQSALARQQLIRSQVLLDDREDSNSTSEEEDK